MQQDRRTSFPNQKNSKMTKSEILSILNPDNARLGSLAYDKYAVTLRDKLEIIGCFAVESVLNSNNENIWKFLLTPNPMNHRFEGQDSITLIGEDIISLKRL